MDHFNFYDYLSKPVILYLLPPLILATLVQWRLKGSGMFITSTVLVIGTTIHELLHFLAGIFTNAKPVSFSIWPKKTENGYLLGCVEFSNIRWYNAIIVGMAPLLAAVLPIFYANWRINTHGEAFALQDLFAWLVIAQMLLSAFPSRQDFLVALRSWPIFAGIGFYHWGLPQL